MTLDRFRSDSDRALWEIAAQGVAKGGMSVFGRAAHALREGAGIMSPERFCRVLVECRDGVVKQLELIEQMIATAEELAVENGADPESRPSSH